MIHNFFLSFAAIFVAMDMIGMIPVYLSMTREMTHEAKMKVVNTSMLVAFVVAIVFLFIGPFLFDHLGISIFDFKIAGGIVLLLISLADLLGSPETVQRASGSTGVIPLAVPLITGPAVLTILVLQVNQQGYGILLASLITNYALTWVVLRKSDRIQQLIGKDGTVVLSKLIALLLAAISVSMVRTGVFEAITHFVHS